MSAKEKKKIDFTQGKIFGKMLLFVLPIVATNLLQMLYNAADMMVVSLSDEPNAVGAIGTVTSFTHLIVNLFIGFSAGANVVVARHIGANDYERTQKAVHTSVIMALIMGFLGAGLGIGTAKPVVRMMGNTGSLLELATTYTYIYFAGVPFLALTNYLIAIFRAKGDSKTPLLVLTCAGIVNVLLNLFFVLVVKMSVEGVALATASANLLSFVVLLWKLRKDKDFTTFSFRKLKLDRQESKEIVRVGLPSGIQGALFSISNMLIQSSIVKVNNAVVPSGVEYQPIVNGSAAAGNLEGFIYTAMNAVYQGAITFTSQNMGAKKLERVKPIMYNGFLLVTGIGVFMSTLVMLLKTPLLSLYGVHVGAEGSLERIGYDAATARLWFLAAPYFLCGIMDVQTGVLRGLGKSISSTVIALIGSCLLRVVWLLTVFPLYPTLEMIFICYPVTWILVSLVDFVFIRVTIRHLRRSSYGVEQ